MITNQHAATLRGMATQLVADQLIQNKRWTKAGLSVLNEGYLSAQAKYERDVAALLAGAEALEAAEAAKAEVEGLRERSELLMWYLRSSERCAWLCGMLGQPFSWFEDPKPQALSALRAARGEK